ncbi:hypothetical protein V2G26_001759 [Clonostachys chloroleuca]
MAPNVRLPPDSDSEYSDPGPEWSDESDIDSVFDNDDHERSECGSDATVLGESSDEDEVDFKDAINLFGGNMHPPEYYQNAVKDFDESHYDGQDYSPGSDVLLDAIEDTWKEFCKVVNRDPKESYTSLSIGILYNFFNWRLNQQVNKDGRKLCGTKKKSSLSTYWKVFRLCVERATGDKIDPKLNRKMHRALRDLAKKHGLSDEKRVNRCMTIEDLSEQIRTTLSTTEKCFQLGEIRILAVLFLLLLAPAGARPASILRLRFGDIRAVFARDPEGGAHNILTRFTLAFTKTYLGVKDAKTFTVPENFFDPSLFLSPHVYLLGILFRHQVFKAPSLTSPDKLDMLDIHAGEKELPLPLKREFEDRLVFRRAVKTLTGYDISMDAPITYGMMARWIRRIGEILGFEYSTIPYSLRYAAANGFDQSVDISEALRNLALDHANSVPFQRHYLGREVNADTWAILRGQKPQQALIKQACSVGHSISKRRPTDLTAEQVASINTHPLIRKLELELRRMKRGSNERAKALRKLRNEKLRLKRSLKQNIRNEWTDSQAVEDIERQLRGEWNPNQVVDKGCRPQGSAQKYLVQALAAKCDDTIEGYYRRRNDAINAIIAYCTVEEGPTMRRKNTSPTEPQLTPTTDTQKEGPLQKALRIALKAISVKTDKERPRYCFLCVGKALTLQPDDPLIKDLARQFYTSGDTAKHFRRRHLSILEDHHVIYCRVCDETLEHKKHLQNHGLKRHGLKT